MGGAAAAGPAPANGGAPAAAAGAGARPVAPAAAAAAGQMGQARPRGFVQEMQALIIGFFTSLLPGDTLQRFPTWRRSVLTFFYLTLFSMEVGDGSCSQSSITMPSACAQIVAEGICVGKTFHLKLHVTCGSMVSPSWKGNFLCLCHGPRYSCVLSASTRVPVALFVS
jgi:hypothetical protein